ncbi:MAG: hypothetical protein AAF206_07050 [Bacteroidota bacterium]
MHIDQAFDEQHELIGIASDERIWKVCYEINNILTINLIENNTLSTASTESTDAHETPTGLFSKQSDPVRRLPLARYEDHASVARKEFILATFDRSVLPKEAKAFRYLLLIRNETNDAPLADEAIIRLKDSNIIRSAVNLSHVNNIKSLFH